MIFNLAVQISGILNRETNTVNRSERLLRIPVADQLPIYETSSKRRVSKRHRQSVTWRSKIRDQGTQTSPYWWHGTRDAAPPPAPPPFLPEIIYEKLNCLPHLGSL